MTDQFSDFQQALLEEGKSSGTIRSFLSDLRRFADWFAQTSGEELTPQRITLPDVRSYQSYLVTVAANSSAKGVVLSRLQPSSGW